MTLVLEQIYTEGIAQESYLVGDAAVGQVAVIDPRRDVDIYLNRARDLGVRITHIIETHIHADFVSGTRELHARTGASIYGGKSTDYRFELEQLSAADELQMGSVTLRAVHTPGHTPEHISLLISDTKQGREPFGVFTGDTLFNLDVGRPDLLGNDREKELAAQLYHSLFDTLLPLGSASNSIQGTAQDQHAASRLATADRARSAMRRSSTRRSRSGPKKNLSPGFWKACQNRRATMPTSNS